MVEFICDVLEFLFLFGIWCIPIFYIITTPYILLVKEEKNKRITLSTVIGPLVLTALMLATNFLEVLAKNSSGLMSDEFLSFSRTNS